MLENVKLFRKFRIKSNYYANSLSSLQFFFSFFLFFFFFFFFFFGGGGEGV